MLLASCVWPNLHIRPLASHGGRGRIRTSVARKERQIYSLLVLATHPPVPNGKTCRNAKRRASELRFRKTLVRSNPNAAAWPRKHFGDFFIPPATETQSQL